jgi:alpha-glucosidase (family GH31 glycosyl hydrolase)
MPDVKPKELPILHCGTEQQTDTLGYVDFTNPNAPELCRRALARGFELGLAGSMVDFGDWVPDNAVFHNGQGGSELHNFYAYDYHRTISELFRERYGDDFILYARSAAPGTQRWLGQFAGDHPSNFDGLEHVLTGALNLCACGYSTWGSDIGGYFGFPQPTVYMRWVQFGCFSPLMRPHGIAPREPWHYGEAAVSNYKFLAWARQNILSYIHNAAAIAHKTGLPIMRSMPVAFPGESEVAAVSDQYMFGPALLVAPVVSEGISRTVTFPSGLWTSLWDGKTIAGPAAVKIAAPLDSIPVYLKSGAIMAVQLNHRLQFGESMTAGRVHALVVTPPSGDETASFANAQGDTAKVVAQANDDGMSWTIGNLPEMDHVLVYGTTAASAVMVNGTTLPNLKSSEPGSAGWEADLARNRLVIRLPLGRVQQSNPSVKIELKVKPAAKQK